MQAACVRRLLPRQSAEQLLVRRVIFRHKQIVLLRLAFPTVSLTQRLTEILNFRKSEAWPTRSAFKEQVIERFQFPCVLCLLHGHSGKLRVSAAFCHSKIGHMGAIFLLNRPSKNLLQFCPLPHPLPNRLHPIIIHKKSPFLHHSMQKGDFLCMILFLINDQNTGNLMDQAVSSSMKHMREVLVTIEIIRCSVEILILI